MGEIVVFVIWGPLMMSACYFVHTGDWKQIETLLFISLPHGLWVVLVLLANNLTDIDYDPGSISDSAIDVPISPPPMMHTSWAPLWNNSVLTASACSRLCNE